MPTRKHLSTFNNEADDAFSSVVEKYSGAYKTEESRIAAKKEATAISTHDFSKIKNKMAVARKEADKDLPIISKYDLYQTVKDASTDSADRDLSSMAFYLKTSWTSDPVGYYTLEEVEYLKKHVAEKLLPSKVFTKSSAFINDVFNRVLKASIKSRFDVRKLDRIASSIDSQESFVTAMELHGFALDRADMDEIRNYIAYKVNSKSEGNIVDTSVFASTEQVKRNLKRLSGSNAEFDVAVLEGITTSDWGQVQSSKRLEKVLGEYLKDNKKTIANKIPLTEALEKAATAYNTDTQRGRTYIAHKDNLGIFYLFSKVGNGDANLIDKFTSFEELKDNVSPLMDLWEV